MARETGLEPATSGVTGRHSNQLSYSRTDRCRSIRVVELGLKGAAIASQAGLESIGEKPLWIGHFAGDRAKTRSFAGETA